MTLAVASSTSAQTAVPHTIPLIVLGSDALLAAAPATPVQLAHACLQAGYANVIPASWGDELIAASVLRHLPSFGPGPAIQCSCPIVAHRLLSVGGDLRPAMLPLVSPPVAIARYVRTLSQPTRTRITYVGSCPGANDDAIDIRMRPDALLAMLAERGISLEEQPRVFESVIPPDRRRFRSQPGGIPTAEALWTEMGARALVEVDGDDLVSEVAQQLLSGRNVLIDVAPRLGCACSGAIDGVAPRDARAGVVALEPPRSATSVVEEHAPIDLDLVIPAAPRSPIDVVARPNLTPALKTASPPTSQPALTPPLGSRVTPVRGLAAIGEQRPQRVSSPVNPRPVLATLPVSKDGAGKSLPRAYIARRRSSPRGVVAVPALDDESLRPVAASTPPVSARGATDASPSVIVAVTQTSVEAPREIRGESPPAPSAPLTARQLIYVAIAAIALALSMSAIVGVVVGRAIRGAPVTTSTSPH